MTWSGSRRSVDRAAVHARFERAVDAVNAEYAPPVPLRIGLGDEFQGIFATLGDGDRARRSGCGWRCCPTSTCGRASAGGGCSVLAEDPRVEDGPGWWAARAAIETVEGYERRAPLRAVRTAYVAADGEPGPGPGAGQRRPDVAGRGRQRPVGAVDVGAAMVC